MRQADYQGNPPAQHGQREGRTARLVSVSSSMSSPLVHLQSAQAELPFGQTHDLRAPERVVPPCLGGQNLKWFRTTLGGVARGRGLGGGVLGDQGGIRGPRKCAAAQAGFERRRIPGLNLAGG